MEDRETELIFSPRGFSELGSHGSFLASPTALAASQQSHAALVELHPLRRYQMASPDRGGGENMSRVVSHRADQDLRSDVEAETRRTADGVAGRCQGAASGSTRAAAVSSNEDRS